ncbi:DUF433 domain-containing protein [bacterium]|nr:DUF433 domain-containing protein [bacterium]
MTDILGQGIYTIREASSLVRLPYHKVSRWVKGYSYTIESGDKKRNRPPLMSVDIPVIEDKFALSFLNVIELLFVKKFLSMGVSLQTIRKASEVAADILKTIHPFAYQRFATDNNAIFLEIEESTGEKSLIDLAKRQQEIRPFIKEYLEDVEFDRITNFATRWRPLGKDVPVIIDPNIAFGKPVVENTRIGTKTIFKQYLVENSIQNVADWFDISVNEVDFAIRYEREVLRN